MFLICDGDYYIFVLHMYQSKFLGELKNWKCEN